MINQSLKDFLFEYVPESKTIWVAYSGGVDSHVLLNELVKLRTTHNFILKAVHLNHGISVNANAWQHHCQQVCKQLEVPLITDKLHLHSNTNNLEATARNLRYEFFAKLLDANDLLFTAHHQDDQVETLLLHLMRGAGVKGLAAMPLIKPFAKGYLARPLLNLTRQTILDYAIDQQLNWINDESNEDTHFSRNLLRHQVIPLLKMRWPKCNEAMARTADLMQQELLLLKEVAAADLKIVVGQQKNCLSVSKLLMLSQVRQFNLLRYWIAALGFLVPDKVKLKIIIDELVKAAPDSKAIIHWHGVELRRWRDSIYLDKPLLKFAKDWQASWQELDNVLQLPVDMGCLSAKQVVGQGVKIHVDDKVIVRFLHEGDSCKIVNRHGTKKLTKWMQEWDVPFWLRNRIPLVVINNQLAAVIGYGVCDGFTVAEDEKGYIFKLN